MIEESRKVGFASEVMAFPIESRASRSEQENRRSWYSKAEMQAIQLRCFTDAAFLESSRDSNDTKTKRRPCRRGLEHLTKEGDRSVRVAVETCVNAVMDEQDRQRLNGYRECALLRIASKEVTILSTNKALKRAIQDAKAARKIHRKDQQEKRESAPTMPKRIDSRDNLRGVAHEKISTRCGERDLNMLKVRPNLLRYHEKTTFVAKVA